MKNTITLSDTHREFLEQTFARNRALFGGYFMEGEDESGDENPEGQEPGEGEEQETDENPEDQESEEEQEQEADDDSELTLEAAKAALAKVRREAAAKRAQVADLTARLEAATTPEQIEEIKSEIKREAAAEARTLLVENVALKHKLPEELADALKGDTREELEAHAKVLAKFVPADEGEDDPELEGGLDANGKPEGGFDPAKRAAELRNRRY